MAYRARDSGVVRRANNGSRQRRAVRALARHAGHVVSDGRQRCEQAATMLPLRTIAPSSQPPRPHRALTAGAPPSGERASPVGFGGLSQETRIESPRMPAMTPSDAAIGTL